MPMDNKRTPLRPTIIVIGAGFGGLWAVRALARLPVDILIFDRHNFHTFLPLLYQVAAAELEPEDIVYPVRSILRRHHNVRFLMQEVTGIDTTARQVRTASQSFHYDTLILSAGSASNFFDTPGAAEHAFELKTLEQAIRLRNHLLDCFECASREEDHLRRLQLLTFVIVGGGPTGVEYAGALAELLNGPLAKDYPELDFEEVHLMLIEASERLLSGFPPRLQAYAIQRLGRMGVTVHTGQRVSQVTSQSVVLADGHTIPSETVIWTAGVQGDPLARLTGLPTARSGQVNVLPTLQVKDHPEVFVIGDLARLLEEERPLPMVAPVAIQQAETVGRNIRRQLSGQPLQPFHYRDPGSMVTIGRNAAVVEIKGRTFTGFIAWLLWLGVHLFNLIGFRNRLLVMVDWAWDYLFYERGVRLIIPLPPDRK